MKYINKVIAGVSCLLLFSSTTLFLQSCKEDIDESNLYTFTGETIEDFLLNNSDEFSNFNYILGRIGYDHILSAYGTYTCFAPRNGAVMAYVDSLYNDESAKEPHNGMQSPGLEGLTDSLCKDIALFHLLGSEVMSVYMGNGMTVKTLLGRDINTAIDSLETGVTVGINRLSHISMDKDSFDLELENGVLHVIDHVITRSNNLVSGELDIHPEKFSLFTRALRATLLIDSLSALNRTDFDEVENTLGFYVPEVCEMGYTVFAETDDALRAHGINTFEDLVEYATQQYAHCADEGSGWYDYARNHKIKVSTGTDYDNPWNVLSMYVRYHILECKVPYDKLVNVSSNASSKATPVEYYETMLPYTLMKVTQNSNKLRLNRWVASNTLTNEVATQGTADMHPVMFEGVELEGQGSQIAASNGYIHPVMDMVVYDKNVPQGALNERMRFDDASLFGEMMSNGYRRISDSEVKALNGGKEGKDKDGATYVLGGSYIRIPNGFFKNLVIYNGEDTRLYYLPGQSNSWSNYQADEFNCKGSYDFAMRLPPVPDGTYELRIGYTAENSRGMLQFYLGSSSELVTMKALDIPLDMRIIPGEYPVKTTLTPLNPCVYTGWFDWEDADDSGVESDATMRNLGYMRGPLSYNYGSEPARSHPKDLRRILTKQYFNQGDYWLRFKTVIKLDAQFHLDYIELCPENVFNNTQYAEDMF